jgi:hypothetical protein
LAWAYQLMATVRKEAATRRRQKHPERLAQQGITYVSKNEGRHLIVTSPRGTVIDFWPGTKLWIVRGSTEQNKGLDDLLKFCLNEAPPSGT